MMSSILLVLVYLAGTCLMSTYASTCPLAPLYPYGTDLGDTAIVEGDDSYFLIDLNHTINFYGMDYDALYLEINGVLSFNRPQTRSKPFSGPYHIPYFTPYWCDVNLQYDYEGRLFYRKVDLEREKDVVALVKIDLEAIGISITPEFIMMFTWKEVKQFAGNSEVNNTFQAVLASGGNMTFLILNYGSITWWKSGGAYAGLVFNRGDKETWTEYPISLTAEVANVADYSNIGFPGRIVTRIDGFISLTSLTRYQCSLCSIDRASGNITTFDGSKELRAHVPHRKYLISKEYLGDEEGQLDQCKYIFKITTDGQGKIEWLSLTLDIDLKRNFAFERKGNNVVEVRGRGPKMLQLIIRKFPYYEYLDENNQQLVIVVEKTAGGWILRSPTCQYYMVYKPLDDSQQLQLFLGPQFKDRTFGMCQNNNNDVTDERMKCVVPPKMAAGSNFASVIGASCSCAKSNKRCSKQLTAM